MTCSTAAPAKKIKTDVDVVDEEEIRQQRAISNLMQNHNTFVREEYCQIVPYIRKQVPFVEIHGDPEPASSESESDFLLKLFKKRKKGSSAKETSATGVKTEEQIVWLRWHSFS